MQPLKMFKAKSLLPVFKASLFYFDVTPKVICTNFDQGLISDKFYSFLNKSNITVKTGPQKQQDQNGSVERPWQTIVFMARNWSQAALLPSTYWWFAIRQVHKVQNLLPTKHPKNNVTSLFELVHGKKVC